jgi:hypothetical protein
MKPGKSQQDKSKNQINEQTNEAIQKTEQSAQEDGFRYDYDDSSDVK